MVRDRDVERIVRGESDPQRAAELLVDAANEAGGDDNITVVVLDVLEVDEAAPPDPDAARNPDRFGDADLDPCPRRRARAAASRSRARRCAAASAARCS